MLPRPLQVATGLTSATNYTVYVSVRAGDTLIATTTTISNVLTPDLQPPSLTRVGPIGNMDTGATQFQMQLPVAVNEPSTVSYAVYRNVSCRTGAPLTEEVLAGGATLPSPARCACNDTNDCAPVATGSAPLMAVLQDTLSIKVHGSDWLSSISSLLQSTCRPLHHKHLDTHISN